jgi:NAD(P)-dependent dehydrogenase (short-subunit alcohol dehydrogenase family)
MIHTEVPLRVAALGGRLGVGALDILYNNVGASTVGDSRVTQTAVEEFRRALDLNLFGMLLCCRHAIPRFLQAGGGGVVNTSLAVGLMGVPDLDSYTAAMGGVVASTRLIAVEGARERRGAHIHDHRAGTGDVQAQAGDGSVHEELLGPASPEDVAYAALFLPSDEARVITGVGLPVDSGVTMS